MRLSVTRIVGKVLPGRLYHWLVVRLARLPGTPARKLPHSVVFRHPLHPRSEHYLAVPTEYSPTILDLPARRARNVEEDIRQWVAATGWRYALVVANFGRYQQTPFLHIHLLQGQAAPRGRAGGALPWLAVELEDGEVESGRRIVRFDTLRDVAEVTTEVNRSARRADG